ncbi:hypothetical protein L7F22_034433 [Adiantum nelumboides]|nr:hypothetical protein [Adiantum nelumboides]
MEELRFLLQSTTVGKLIERNKRQLICVQHTATLGEVLQPTARYSCPVHFEQLRKRLLVVGDEPGDQCVGGYGYDGKWGEASNGCVRKPLIHRTDKQDLDDKEESLIAGYCMITQRDILQFIQTEREKFKPILSKSVESLRIYEECVLGVSRLLPLVDTLRCMQQSLSTIVPIVDYRKKMEHYAEGQLVDVKGKLIAGSLSVIDLKGCPLEALCTWANREVLDFLKKAHVMTLSGMIVDDINAHEDGAFQMDQALVNEVLVAHFQAMDEEDDDDDEADDNEDQQGTLGHDHGLNNDDNQDDPPSGTRSSTRGATTGGATTTPSNPLGSQSEPPPPALS